MEFPHLLLRQRLMFSGIRRGLALTCNKFGIAENQHGCRPQRKPHAQCAGGMIYAGDSVTISLRDLIKCSAFGIVKENPSEAIFLPPMRPVMVDAAYVTAKEAR
jgi:hypothetical protein